MHQTLVFGEVEALREGGVTLFTTKVAQTFVHRVDVVDEMRT